MSLIEIRDERIQKINKLRSLGINPYPSTTQKDTEAGDVSRKYNEFEGKTVTVSGRLMGKREHGGLTFGHVQDQSGQVQLYLDKALMSETSKEEQTIGADDLSLIDIGDIIEATGVVGKTQRGEVSIKVNKLRMLAKSMRPLPDKREGLKDPELLYRKRYLDMIMNPEKRYRFQKGAEILFAIREFLNSKGFIEIKTPIIQPNYGGTSAKPFRTHVNALSEDFYLAISHELYLKRLITAGFENVYNIVGYFRNEGIDRTHNPEFTMIETMTAFQNYEYNMELTEEMYRYIGEKVFGKTTFKVKGHEIDFAKPWRRIRMLDAVKEYADIDFDQVNSIEEAHKVLDDIGYEGDKPETVGECMVVVFEEKVEEQLIQPTFITAHPVEISPLAKQMEDDPRFVERFEGFIAGIEAGDNYSELNDPQRLFENFKTQVAKRKGGDDEAHPMDIEFVEMMEHGMPPTTGLGPGIERLTMMFTETDYIDDVIFFPMMRPAKITQLDKDIYGEENISGGGGGEFEQDFSKKISVAVRSDIEPWQFANTIGHISAYLGNKTGEDFGTGDYFETQDGEKLPRNCQYPIVIFKAELKDLRKLLVKIREQNLPHIGFTRDMIETTNDAELVERTKEMKDEDVDYFGVGVFGENETLEKLTKKLSLYK